MFHLLFDILNLLLMYLLAQLWYFWSESFLCATLMLLLNPFLFELLLFLTYPLFISLLEIFNDLSLLKWWFRPRPFLPLTAILNSERRGILLGYLWPKGAFILSVSLDLLLQLFHVLFLLPVPLMASLFHGLLFVIVKWLWNVLKRWFCPGLLVWWKVMRSWNFWDVDLLWEAWVTVLESDDRWFKFTLFHFVYSPLEIEVLAHHFLFFLFLIHPPLVSMVNVQAMFWIWFYAISKVLWIFLPIFSI